MSSIKDLTTFINKAVIIGYENTRGLHSFGDVAKIASVIKTLEEYHSDNTEKKIDNKALKELYTFLFACLDGMQQNKAFGFDDATGIHSAATKIHEYLKGLDEEVVEEV